MSLAVISIGNEITTGTIVDTNSAWISDLMLGHGIETRLHLSVPDDLKKMIRAFKIAQSNATKVIVTGGLGPTEDDLTTEAACRFIGVDTVLNQNALETIAARFRAINREMTENNRKQAMIPEGSEILENPVGTAPGYTFKTKKTTFFFVPGVPRECQLMIEQQVLPRILAQTISKKIFKSLTFRTFGMTESQLDQCLSELKLPRNILLGYRAIFPEIHLKITASGKTETAVNKGLARAEKAIEARVGGCIYSRDGRPLEEVVGDILRAGKKTLALAESCTGGLIAKRLTDIPGSSDFFLAGFVTYSNEAKKNILGIPESLIKEKGAVSSEVSRAMAEAARLRAGADLAVGVTGIAGPAGGSAEKPVGTVHIAIADENGTWDGKFFLLRAERTQIRELAAQAALEIIRRRMLGMEDLK